MEQRCFVMPPRCFAAAFLTDAGGGETTRVDAEGSQDGGMRRVAEGVAAVGTVANVERERGIEKGRQRETRERVSPWLLVGGFRHKSSL